MKLIYTLSIIFFICFNSSKNYFNYEKKTSVKLEKMIRITNPKNIFTTLNSTQQINPIFNDEKKSIYLKFKEFELEIYDTEIYNNQRLSLDTILGDTVCLGLMITDSIDNKIIKIKQIYEGKINVFQQLENSLTISDRGPHCDLINWHHYKTA